MVAFWTVVGSLVIIAAWSAATATLMAFQGDARAKMAEHEAQMQALYEARLAEIRARIDRVTSRQTLDQEQLELKLDQIVRRQSVLEQHATSIGTISDSAANRANARNEGVADVGVCDLHSPDVPGGEIERQRPRCGARPQAPKR
jgi:hypothetical protein